MKSVITFSLIVMHLWSLGVQAQETLALSDDDITRFGIRFNAVATMDGNTGMKVPATVINSPLAVSMLTSRYEGVVQRWQVRPGEDVEANQLLGVISSQEVLGIQQDWVLAEGSLAEARFNLDKDEQLFSEGVISEQRLVQTRRHFNQTQIHARAAREKLVLAGYTATQLAQLQESGTGLGLYYLRAPMAGQVSRLAMNAGAHVSANSELVSFNTGNLWIRADLPVRLGQDLSMEQTLRLANSDDRLTLKLMDLKAEEDSQMVEIYAEFNHPVSYLSGQIVSLLLTPAAGGILVPPGAVVHSGDLTQVFVRTAGGVEVRTLSLVPVGNAYLTFSGLAAGDELVTRGTAQLKGIQLGLGGE